MKASEKQKLAQKLVDRLAKDLPAPPAETDGGVLATIVFAIGLEAATLEQAQVASKRLESEFHDLNEIRVSTITELMAPFEGYEDREKRANGIRTCLQDVFESQYNYDLEPVRKMTLEQAVKRLSKIRGVTPFVRNHTLLTTLKAHLIPVDRRGANALAWCGLIDPGMKPADAAEAVKPFVRKADAARFGHFVREFASKYAVVFSPDAFVVPEGGFDPNDAAKRLDALLKGKMPQPAVKEPEAVAEPAAKKAAKKATKKAAPKKSAPAKAAASAETTAKKPPVNKAAAKKAPAKKAAAAKKAPAKAAAKKAPAKKAAVKKAAAKKAAPAKKAPAKAAAKKTAKKKTAAKKAAAKKKTKV